MFFRLALIFFLFLPLVAEDKIKSNDAVVFMYHRFDEAKYPSTNIRLEQFKFQLDYLTKNNYNVIHLSKLVNLIIQKKPIPPKTVCITIDDAYKSVFTKAYPMLKKRGFAFTVFVNTNAINHKSKFYMSWEQMRQMQENGAEFANHSLSHPYLLRHKDETQKSWQDRITSEILKAQIRLQEELGIKTNENPNSTDG